MFDCAQGYDLEFFTNVLVMRIPYVESRLKLVSWV